MTNRPYQPVVWFVCGVAKPVAGLFQFFFITASVTCTCDPSRRNSRDPIVEPVPTVILCSLAIRLLRIKSHALGTHIKTPKMQKNRQATWQTTYSRPSDNGPVPVDALSVDVEDYFHVEAFASKIPYSQWPQFPQRVRENTLRVLDLFAEHDCRATFFVLGWVAEREPRLVREIAERGHEVACHSYAHRRVFTMTRAELDRKSVV